MSTRGPTPTHWTLPPHTAAKHDLLKRYLDAWYPKMAKFSRRVIYLDGFAGPGVYDNGEPGSPIIALDRLLTHSYFAKMSKTEFLFVFFEGEPDRFESLEAELERYKAAKAPWPGNVETYPEPWTFEEGAEALLASLGDKKLAPAFLFIDPFGVKGVTMNTVRRLSAFPKGEVFIFLNVDFGRRFSGKNVDQSVLDDLFGTDGHRESASLTGERRAQFLIQLYESQLLDVCGFKYVRGFEMENRAGKKYRLVYGTRHIEGLRAMKYAMWKLDPSGTFRFSDRRLGVIDLFGRDAALAEAKTEIRNQLAGRRMTIEKVEEWVLAETPFADSHYKKPLAALEKEGLVQAERPPGKKAGFGPGTIVHIRPLGL